MPTESMFLRWWTSMKPLSSFTLQQFNEALFTDQLRKALSGLCKESPLGKTDSLAIEEVITAFSKQKLYDRMLEASLEVNDAAVYAGELQLFKRVSVTYGYDTTRRKKVDSFTVVQCFHSVPGRIIENIKVEVRLPETTAC